MEKVIHKLVLKDEEGCEGRGDLGEKDVTADQDQGEAIDTVHERQQDPAWMGDGIKAMTEAGNLCTVSKFILQDHPI